MHNCYQNGLSVRATLGDSVSLLDCEESYYMLGTRYAI